MEQRRRIILRELQGEDVPDLGPQHTSYSFRYGSANTIVNHPTTELWHAIARGGWDFKSLCSVFEYLLKVGETVLVAGRALAGWRNSRKPCAPPRFCDDILHKEDNTAKVNLMMENLFDQENL